MTMYNEKGLEYIRAQGLDPSTIAAEGFSYDAHKKVLRGLKVSKASIGGKYHKTAFSIKVDTPPPWVTKGTK